MTDAGPLEPSTKDPNVATAAGAAVGGVRPSEHLWISEIEATQLRQRLVGKAHHSALVMQELLTAVLALSAGLAPGSLRGGGPPLYQKETEIEREIETTPVKMADREEDLQMETESADEAEADSLSPLEALQELFLSKLRSGSSSSIFEDGNYEYPSEGGDGTAADTGGIGLGGFSAADLALSKKEAQSRLSPSDFKLWKKAQRASKKSSRSSSSTDDE